MGRKKQALLTVDEISIDEKSGSRAFNRLDMQVSQVLYMAIELYDTLDYLFILDKYDDITIFDTSQSPFIVSYYQMKTNESSISINTVISEKWFAKLYKQLIRPKWLVKELGLITNCQLDVNFSIVDKNGKRIRREIGLNDLRTPINRLPIVVLAKIKDDIANSLNIPKENVDLSKFVHMRTVLSIAGHREMAEQKLTSFLNDKYPGLKIETAKAIFRTMLTLLSEKQGYERLHDEADFNSVINKKGVFKKDIQKIIDDSILISVPQAADILNMAKEFGENEKGNICIAYTQILSDRECMSSGFRSVIYKVKQAVTEHPYNSESSFQDYLYEICEAVYSKNSSIKLVYNEYYIMVLAMSIMLNEMRN